MQIGPLDPNELKAGNTYRCGVTLPKSRETLYVNSNGNFALAYGFVMGFHKVKRFDADEAALWYARQLQLKNCPFIEPFAEL